MNFRNLVILIISIAICQAAAIIGSVFTVPAIPTWYASLQKPYFNPPNWIFAPVWTTLFLLMGIALYLVVTAKFDDNRVRTGLSVFFFQLILNIGWSYLFFGLQQIFYALLEIIILWAAILLTIYQFRKIDKKASYLLVPYLLWVSFAAIVNYAIWTLNIQ